MAIKGCQNPLLKFGRIKDPMNSIDIIVEEFNKEEQEEKKMVYVGPLSQSEDECNTVENSNQSHPFRSSAMMLAKTEPKKQYGLIIAPAPKQVKQHKCKLPSLFRIFLSVFTTRTINIDSLFRCHCKRVYYLNERLIWTALASDRGENEWRRLGGVIEND